MYSRLEYQKENLFQTLSLLAMNCSFIHYLTMIDINLGKNIQVILNIKDNFKFFQYDLLFFPSCKNFFNTASSFFTLEIS